MTSVVPVSEARADLTRTLKRFRADPEGADPVFLGSHRRTEAVLIPVVQYARMQGADSASRGSIRSDLHRRRDLIASLARASRIGEVRVFGSVARGDDTDASDVDLLVRPEAGASLFDLVRFESDMAELLGRDVDVVSVRSLDPVKDAAILSDAQEL